MSTMTNRGMRSGAAVLAVLFCTAAMAQQEPSSKEEDRSKQSTVPSEQKQAESKQRASSGRTGSDAKSMQRAPSVVVGEVVEMRTSSIKEQPGAHRLIKVETQNGNTAVIDAGPDTAATKDLQKGDRVVAVGRAGRINDRPVLVARSVGELYSTGVTGSKQGTDAARQRKSD